MNAKLVILFSFLLFASLMTGCMSGNDGFDGRFHVDEGFYWDYGELKVWHVGNGYVMDGPGLERKAEFIGVQFPGWMKSTRGWDDSWDEIDYFDDPERSLQKVFAVTPDLEETIAFRDYCPDMKANSPAGPWHCSDFDDSDRDRNGMFWLPAGWPWLFGASEFMDFGDERISSESIGHGPQWVESKSDGMIRLTGTSPKVPLEERPNLPEDMLRFFERGVLYVEDGSGPPAKIEVERSDGTAHSFLLNRTGNIPEADRVVGAQGAIAERPEVLLQERSDFLPFDTEENPDYTAIPWSEVWEQVEEYVENPSRTVVLQAGYDGSARVFFQSGLGQQVDLYYRINMTLIFMEEGGNPFGFHVSRTESYPQIQQIVPMSDAVLTEYSVDSFSGIETEQRLLRNGLPTSRMSLDEAADLANWMGDEWFGGYRVTTHLENETALRMVYSFSGGGVGYSIDASTGESIRLHAESEAIDRFWSPKETMVPYRAE